MATPDEIRRAREQSSIFNSLFDYIRANEAQLASEGRRPVLGGLLSKEPVMGTDTIRYEGVGPMLAGLLEPLARGVDAPRAAAQGLIPQEDMIGEALGTAGAAMVGGGAVAKPASALGANTLRVYHGGPKRLSASEVEMRPDPEGTPIGFSVTDNPDVAEYYKNMRGGGSISEFDIDLDRANIISESELYEFIDDLENKLDADASYEQIQQGLLDAGIDAIEYPNPEFGIRVVNPNILGANASKGSGLLTTSAAELRRQANIQRFGYDPNETPEVDTSYRGSHQPVGPQDENPIRLDDITKSITGEDAGYPEDFYSSQGMRLYAQPPSFPGDEYGIANQQSYQAIQAVRGNPDAEVTIYRGVPDSDDITTINPGDFVTLSPKYAELHAASGYGPRGEDAGKVISQRVKVRDVYFAGDDVNEFGYFPTDVAANASKPTGLLVLEQQARGKPDLKNLFDANNIDISDLSKADPGEIKGVLDMAVRRQVINPRQAESYLKGLLD